MSLIAHWKLNENNTEVPALNGNTTVAGTFQTLIDSSGNDNHLYVSQGSRQNVYYQGLISIDGPGGLIPKGMRNASLGKILYNPNNYWQMLCFTGIVNSNNVFNLYEVPNGIPYSISFWVKSYPHEDGFGTLINHANLEIKFKNLQNGIIPNKLGLKIRAVDIEYTVPNDGNWHHFAFVILPNAVNANDTRFYIDGVLTNGTITSNSSTFSMGGYPGTFALFNGFSNSYLTTDALADVRIYDHDLSLNDVVELFQLTESEDTTSNECNIIANWQLNEPSFNSTQLPFAITDYSGFNRHLVTNTTSSNINGYTSIAGPYNGSLGLHANKSNIGDSIVSFYTNENAFPDGFQTPITLTFWIKKIASSEEEEVYETITNVNTFLQISAVLNSSEISTQTGFSLKIKPYGNLGTIWFDLPNDLEWHFISIILPENFVSITDIVFYIDNFVSTYVFSDEQNGSYDPSQTFFNLNLGIGTSAVPLIALSNLTIRDCVYFNEIELPPEVNLPNVVEDNSPKTGVNEIAVVLSGGKYNNNPLASLGGDPSNIPIIGGNINNLFDNLDFDIKDLEKPYIDYRCFYIINNGRSSIYNLKLISLGEEPYTGQLGVKYLNEIQKITIFGIPNSGSLTLSYGQSQFTTNVNNASDWAIQIQDSLNNLDYLNQVKVTAQQNQNQLIFDIDFSGGFGGNGFDDKRNHSIITHVNNTFNLNVETSIIQKGSPINSIATALAEKTTKPTNINFSDNIVVKRFSPGDKIPIWVKRQLDKTNINKNQFVIRVQADSSPAGQNSEPEPYTPSVRVINLISNGVLKLSGSSSLEKFGNNVLLFSGSAIVLKGNNAGLILSGRATNKLDYGYCCCEENIMSCTVTVTGTINFDEDNTCNICQNMNDEYYFEMTDTSNTPGVCLIAGNIFKCENTTITCGDSSYQVYLTRKAEASINIGVCPAGSGDPPIISLTPTITLSIGLSSTMCEDESGDTLGNGVYVLNTPVEFLASEAPYECIGLLSGTYNLQTNNSDSCLFPTTIDVEFSDEYIRPPISEPINIYDFEGSGFSTFSGSGIDFLLFTENGDGSNNFGGETLITTFINEIGNGTLILSARNNVSDIFGNGIIEFNGTSTNKTIFNIVSTSGISISGGIDSINGYNEIGNGTIEFNGNSTVDIVADVNGGVWLHGVARVTRNYKTISSTGGIRFTAVATTTIVKQIISTGRGLFFGTYTGGLLLGGTEKDLINLKFGGFSWAWGNETDDPNNWGPCDEITTCNFEVSIGEPNCFGKAEVIVECGACQEFEYLVGPGETYGGGGSSGCYGWLDFYSRWSHGSCGEPFYISIYQPDLLLKLRVKGCYTRECFPLTYVECPIVMEWGDDNGHTESFELAEACFSSDDPDNTDCGGWGLGNTVCGTYSSAMFKFTLTKDCDEGELELDEWSWFSYNSLNDNSYGWCLAMDEPIIIKEGNTLTAMRCGGYGADVIPSGDPCDYDHTYVLGFIITYSLRGVGEDGEEYLCIKQETVILTGAGDWQDHI